MNMTITSKQAEPVDITFRVTVRFTSSKPLYRQLRGAIKAAIDAFPYMRFVSITSEIEPDPFDLDDPNNPPQGWK